ncbi:MAG: alpha/beta hydrolase [Candidatus Tectomicrobia bacterium]
MEIPDFIPYDIRGMGCTDSSPGEYTLDQHAEDLYQLVRHLALTEFVLGGLSIGGMMTVHFALAHQELLKGIIIASPCDLAHLQAGQVRDEETSTCQL